MRILVTNDDGIYAPGIIALAKEMQCIGEVMVVAPDRDMTASSGSLTLRTPVRIKTIKQDWIAVEGTPTDCVHLALGGVLGPPPDIVVSGVNHGANLGDDVFYSGTVAAAIEGRYLGAPSLAVSLNVEKGFHYDTAAKVAGQFVNQLQEKAFAKDTVLNINVPDRSYDELEGIDVTRLGSRHLSEKVEKSFDPHGREIYWIGPPGPDQDAGIGTDFFAVRTGKVSITPLNLDMTNYKLFDQISSWLPGILDEKVL